MDIGYFWKHQPERSLATDRYDEYKKDKHRLTIMVCANADGAEKVPSWIIGKAANPR